MTASIARPASSSDAGVLELLRRFKTDEAAADRNAADCLEQAKAVEPLLKAFEYLPRDTTRRPGPLSGIPVAIKDIIATHDMPTTNGSPVYKDHVPAADAWVVERLRNLGATIFGKTVSTEFAWRHPGPTVNPWNTDHTPGGSSSGSAAAVAAGIVPLALGTQTLGSVIRPAAFNGVVGLKPSFGAIPRTGVHPLSPSLDHVGFFARRVDDVALALSLLAGSSDSDPHGRPLPGFQVDIDRGLSRWKSRASASSVSKNGRAPRPNSKQAFDAAIAKLRDAGAVLEELELSELDQVNWTAINTILACEGAAIFADLVARHPDRTSDHLKSLVEAGKNFSRDRLSLSQGDPGNAQERFRRRDVRLRRVADIAGVRRSAARIALYRRCRILRTMDVPWRTRRDASDRIRQEQAAARPSDRRRIPKRSPDAPRGKMDRDDSSSFRQMNGAF